MLLTVHHVGRRGSATSGTAALAMAPGAARLLGSALRAAAEHVEGPEVCPAARTRPGEAKATSHGAPLQWERESCLMYHCGLYP